METNNHHTPSSEGESWEELEALLPEVGFEFCQGHLDAVKAFVHTTEERAREEAAKVCEGMKIEHPSVCKVWDDENTHCTCDRSPYTHNAALAEAAKAIRNLSKRPQK